MNINMEDIIKLLSVQKPIFHNEDDFKFNLAINIQTINPECEIRLERREPLINKPTYPDIRVHYKDSITAIELKYKTRGLIAEVGGEYFALRDQAAQPPNRYLFLNDIQRLENAVKMHHNTEGYALMITNDSAYWKSPRDTNPIDTDFRIHEGRLLSGRLAWGIDAGKGTKKGKEQPILLKNKYICNWHDYSTLSPNTVKFGNYTIFKYLLIHVM